MGPVSIWNIRKMKLHQQTSYIEPEVIGYTWELHTEAFDRNIVLPLEDENHFVQKLLKEAFADAINYNFRIVYNYEIGPND